MWTGDERETSIVMSDANPVVLLWSAQRKYVNRILADNRWTVLDSGVNEEGQPWVSASIPADKYSPLTGVKRANNMTPEQKAASAERLRRIREAK